MVPFLVALEFVVVEFFDERSKERAYSNDGHIVEVCRAEVGVDVHGPNVGGSVSAEIVGDAGWNPYGSQRWHDPT
jgi:hypothetical protein